MLTRAKAIAYLKKPKLPKIDFSAEVTKKNTYIVPHDHRAPESGTNVAPKVAWNAECTRNLMSSHAEVLFEPLETPSAAMESGKSCVAQGHSEGFKRGCACASVRRR